MTNLTLYWLIPKDRSSRVRWLLRELGVEFREQQMNASVGEHRSGDYLDLNPFGKVPAIVTDDLTLSESGAILLYLLELFDSENKFSPERDTNLWPSFLQWFFWGLTTLEGAVFIFNGNQGEKERVQLERFLVPLDRMLESNDYLAGESFTAADIVCAYDLGILSSVYDLNAFPSIHAYLSRLLARPAATSFTEAIQWP
jgi:glutathione S-transferase